MPSKKENFEKYMNPVFIETGSYVGDGIQQAIDAGYQRVISIELSDKYHGICCNRFSSNDKVSIVLGDSFKVLPSIINNIEEKITFWLDGHHSCGDTALGEHWAPLMQELDAISKHKINTHTIMIDDMRCWLEVNDVHGFTTKDIMEKLISINADYKFVYEDGEQEKDILVAYI